jgi:hypothetical protein
VHQVRWLATAPITDRNPTHLAIYVGISVVGVLILSYYPAEVGQRWRRILPKMDLAQPAGRCAHAAATGMISA